MTVKLNDVIDRITGNVDRFNTDLKYYVGGEHYESSNLTIPDMGLLKSDDGSKLGFKFHFPFRKGDVLFMARNPHLRKAGMAMEDGICSDASYILRTKDDNVLRQRYLPIICQQDAFWDYFEANKTGSVNFLMNWKDLKEYKFELPNIKDQDAICKKIWAAHALRTSYKKLIAATDELVKSQFIEMFGDTHAKSDNSRKWNEVVKIINGKDYKAVQMEEGGYPVYGTGGEMARASDYLCPENSVLLGRKGTIDNPLLIKERYWNVDTAFGAVPDESVLNIIYFYWHCKFIDFKLLNKGTTLPSTTKVDLLNLWIKVPEMDKQKEFAIIVEQADKSKFELKKSIEQIDRVIKALMQ